MNHLKQVKASTTRKIIPIGYKIIDAKRKITPKLDEVKYRTMGKFKKTSAVRRTSCQSTNPTNVLVNLNYFKLDILGGTMEDVAGVFTSNSEAIKIAKCLNKQHHSTCNMLSPYKVMGYKLGTIINSFPTYKYPSSTPQSNIVYIVYSQVECGPTTITALAGINISQTELKNAYNLVDFSTVKYKLNTIFPTLDFTDYDVHNPLKKQELYKNEMFKIAIEIPYLDKLGIKYTAWDNYHNTAGTCMWHAISKALDMSIPEIAKNIKYMTAKYPKSKNPKTLGSSRKELYKKLVNYRTVSSSIMPEECRLIPQFTKTTGIVIFNSKSIHTSIYHNDYKNNVCCFFPKNPKQVIFIGIMYVTGATHGTQDKGSPHAVVLTLGGKKLNNNWSEPIDVVKNELYKILPDVCKKELLPR